MLKLTEELWQDSQVNELGFWKKEKDEGGLDQKQRNQYYLNWMEGQCSLIKDYFDSNDVSNKTVIDLGSGPEGILHVITARRKIAVDPLMDEFKKLGFNVRANNVIAVTGKAEDLASMYVNVDLILCLNSIDHHQDPEEVIKQCHEALAADGDLIILTDTRTKEQCDVYHKLPLTEESLTSWIEPLFNIQKTQIFPHGEGNPVKQYCIIAKKKAS